MQAGSDLVIRKYAAWQKAVGYQPKAAHRAQRCADKAVVATGHALLAAGVRGPEGVQCHVRRALWLRTQQETEASMRKGRVYAPFAGFEIEFDDNEVDRFAEINSGPPVVPLLSKALKWLDERRPGAVALLRQALTAVRRRPSPSDEHWEVDRHLELVVAYLATPQVTSRTASKKGRSPRKPVASNDNSPPASGRDTSPNPAA
jgi:hypothetical protein